MPISKTKATFSAPPQTVWRIVTDNRNTQWRSDLSRVEVSEDGCHFTEYAKNGFPTEFTITLKNPCKQYEFHLKNQNLTGRWSGIFSVVPGGTEIEFTEVITVKNPIMRLLAGFYLKRQQRTYIRDLKKAVEK